MSDPLDELRSTYRQMPDGKLLELASQPELLTPTARSILMVEILRRGITEEILKTENPEVPEESPSNSEDLPSWRLLGSETPELPPSEFTAVYSAEDGSGAERAQGLLRAAGIESQLQIVVLVANADSEKAIQIITEQLGNDSESE